MNRIGGLSSEPQLSCGFIKALALMPKRLVFKKSRRESIGCLFEYGIMCLLTKFTLAEQLAGYFLYINESDVSSEMMTDLKLPPLLR